LSRFGRLVAQTGAHAGNELFMNFRDAVVLPLQRDPDSLPLDRELVERALGGEQLARQLLYRRHVRSVMERVTRLLARSAEAEDVVQDAFVTAFADLGQLTDRSRFAGWLMRIALHQTQRRFRRRRLLARLGLDRGSDDARLEQVADPGLSPEQRLQLARLDRALARLPVELRLPWMLRHVEGCELNEIADQCACSLATVKRRIIRADERLKRWLNGEPADAEGTP
jgi:RNA polymerase sigma-70 factor, ECF subfamily